MFVAEVIVLIPTISLFHVLRTFEKLNEAFHVLKKEASKVFDLDGQLTVTEANLASQ